MPLVVIGSWVIIGLVVGFIISKVYKSSDGPAVGIMAAAVAAVILAIAYSVIEGRNVMSFAPWALIYAGIGAVGGGLMWHIVRSRFAAEQSHTVRRSY